MATKLCDFVGTPTPTIMALDYTALDQLAERPGDEYRADWLPRLVASVAFALMK
jgi:hypothetical protein